MKKMFVFLILIPAFLVLAEGIPSPGASPAQEGVVPALAQNNPPQGTLPPSTSNKAKPEGVHTVPTVIPVPVQNDPAQEDPTAGATVTTTAPNPVQETELLNIAKTICENGNYVFFNDDSGLRALRITLNPGNNPSIIQTVPENRTKIKAVWIRINNKITYVSQVRKPRLFIKLIRLAATSNPEKLRKAATFNPKRLGGT